MTRPTRKVGTDGDRLLEDYDYIIAGAGAAGCVLAYRLSEDPSKRVLLLEAGPEDRHPLIHMPKGIGKILGQAAYVWPFTVTPKPGSNLPPALWLRGRTLGGSTSVNGLMYVRGQPADFEQLAALTSKDWDWAHIGAAYKALEHHELGEAETRGAHGPLKISVRRKGDKVLDLFIKSAQAYGLPEQEDVNAPDNAEKVGYATRTIWKGKRQSSAVAFLKPARKRPNLTVRTGQLVDRVLFEGTCAVGAVTTTETFRGKRIILSGGALASPAILQRSGVGPRALLTNLGIEVVADRPEVGRNLREHSSVVMQWRLKGVASDNPQYRGWRLFLNGVRYYLTRTGPLANATFDLGAWLKTRPGLERPDGQLIIGSYTIDYTSPDMTVEPAPGMQIGIYPLRPRSQGTLMIASKDPSVLPTINHDFFDDPEDRREMADLVRATRRIVETKPIADIVVGETRPGAELQTDEEILAGYARDGSTGYHAVGTCRMGSDEASIVDPMTRVRGVDNLHVVDLSIAPFVVAGNTYAPAAAMAWRAADLIKTL